MGLIEKPFSLSWSLAQLSIPGAFHGLPFFNRFCEASISDIRGGGAAGSECSSVLKSCHVGIIVLVTMQLIDLCS